MDWVDQARLALKSWTAEECWTRLQNIANPQPDGKVKPQTKKNNKNLSFII